MGEEGTNIRLLALEDLAKDSKKNQKEIEDKIVIIEKLNIKQEVILNAIMWTLRAMLGVFIAFVLENGLMYYIAKIKG